MKKFAGTTLSTWSIYEKDSVNTPFLLKNYKVVLREMYDAGDIQARKANGKPIKQGFANDVLVTFPTSKKVE